VYFSDDDRRLLELAVDPQTGQLFRAMDPSRTPVNLVGKDKVMPIFVMDAQGRIYAYPEPKSGEIHHSSLAAGQPVALAGQLVIKNGYITHIDNMSGHYQPTLEQLSRARTFLGEKLGANLEQAARVGVKEAWVRDATTGQLKRSVRLVDLDRDADQQGATTPSPENSLDPRAQSGASRPVGAPRRRNRTRHRPERCHLSGRRHRVCAVRRPRQAGIVLRA
jgi:hypothetical protein